MKNKIFEKCGNAQSCHELLLKISAQGVYIYSAYTHFWFLCISKDIYFTLKYTVGHSYSAPSVCVHVCETDCFTIISVNLLTRESTIDLKCTNFIVFILYFCEFAFDLLVDCMFYCYICTVLSCLDFKMPFQTGHQHIKTAKCLGKLL